MGQFKRVVNCIMAFAVGWFIGMGISFIVFG